jgi:hypothetical protein
MQTNTWLRHRGSYGNEPVIYGSDYVVQEITENIAEVKRIDLFVVDKGYMEKTINGL